MGKISSPITDFICFLNGLDEINNETTVRVILQYGL